MWDSPLPCGFFHPALLAWSTALPGVLSVHLFTSLVGLADCFFNSLVVGVPCSLIFWHFWLFIDFRLVVILLLVVQGREGFLPTPPSWLELWNVFILKFIFSLVLNSMCEIINSTPVACDLSWNLNLGSLAPKYSALDHSIKSNKHCSVPSAAPAGGAAFPVSSILSQMASFVF